MQKIKFILLFIIAVSIASCKMGSDFEKPEFQTNKSYRFTINSDSLDTEEWWTLFNDKSLDSLVQIALDTNLDVLTLASRVEQARYNMGYTKADMLPNFGVQAGAMRGNFAQQKMPSTSNNFAAGVNMAWELDFWGKFRRLNEAAQAEYLSSEYGLINLKVAIVTEVVSTYFTLIDYKARYDVALKTLESRVEYLNIIQQRYDAGVIPEIDLNQAQMQKAIAETAIPSYRRLLSKVENSLSILISRSPYEIITTSEIMDMEIPETVPNGMPSELLERRPDIKQAEMNLMAQNARVGAAIAMRFPSISLSAFAGGASDELSTFTASGLAWNTGLNLVGPLFNFGKNKRRVDIEREKTKQALYSYNKTVLQAFREVEDALIDIETYSNEINAREDHFNAANSAMNLAQLRYDKGVTSYLEVLEFQRQAFEAELNLIKTKQEFMNSYIRLYKSVGGRIDMEKAEK